MRYADRQATYNYTAPPALTFTDPVDANHDGCEFDAADLATAQGLLNTSLSDWVTAQTAAFAAAGGCSPTVTNDFMTQALDYCTDGSVTITWTIEDLCDTQTRQATYKYTAPPSLTFTDPVDANHDGCEFDAADLATAQGLLNTSLSDWVTAQTAAFAAAGGCSPTVTNDFTTQALDYCTDGSVTITWTIEDLCDTQTARLLTTIQPHRH